jgi:hypothetical protein
LFWDVVLFVVLGAIVESRDRIGLMVTLTGSALAISAMLWCCCPTIFEYRGLSGIDSALFAHAAIVLCIDARRAGHTVTYRLILLSVLGFAAKIGYELDSGTTVFVDSAGADFTALPSVHMMGGLVGGLCGWALTSRGEREKPRPCQPARSDRRCATTNRMLS